MRSTFRHTVQRLYNEISQYGQNNPSVEAMFRESLVLLQLSGAQEDRENLPLRESHSITHFFTKGELD